MFRSSCFVSVIFSFSLSITTILYSLNEPGNVSVNYREKSDIVPGDRKGRPYMNEPMYSTGRPQGSSLHIIGNKKHPGFDRPRCYCESSLISFSSSTSQVYHSG